MATTPVIPVWLGQLGIARETTQFTGVSPTTSDQFFPIEKPKLELIVDPIYDRGFRSKASLDYAVNGGFRYGRYTFDTQAYPIPVGTLFMALLGGTDSNSPAGTHGIPQLNTGLPPTYTIWDYDATQATSRELTGCFLDSLSLSYQPTGLLKTTASFVGKFDTPVTKPTATFATDQPFLPWQNAAKVNGLTAVGARLIKMQLDLKRSWEGIWGAGGTQDLTASNSGPIEATGTIVFAPIDTTEIDYYRNNTQGQFQALFTSGANTLTINMNTTAFEKGTIIDRSGQTTLISAKIRGIDNSTDGGVLKVTAVNTKTTVY